MRIGQADGGQAVVQPRQVLAPAEHAASEDRDHLVDAVREQEAAIHRRDARLVQWQVTAIQITVRQWFAHDACGVAGRCYFIHSLALSISRPMMPASSTGAAGYSG